MLFVVSSCFLGTFAHIVSLAIIHRSGVSYATIYIDGIKEPMFQILHNTLF